MVKNLTEGKPLNLLFFFALPMVAGNLFQQLYNMVDTAVVGKFVGEDAVAAVGSSFPIVFLSVAVASGLSMGCTVVVSQLFGAGRIHEMKSTISTAITGLGISYTALFHKPDCRISLHDSFKPDREIIHRALELGVPTALEHATVSAGQIVVTRINATLGTVALAADHVAVTAEGLSYMPADGISYAATALVGQSYGAQEFEDAHRFGKLSGLTGLAFSTVMGIMLFIFATPLANIFSSDPAVIELAAQMLRIVAIAEPLFGVAIVMSGALRGLGDTRFPLVISLIGMWGVRCVLAPTLVFGFKIGLAGSWIAMVCDLCVRGLLCALRFKRFTPQYLAENHR